EPRGGERPGDLLHLADEAPRLPRVAGDGGLRARAETGLGALPLGTERFVHALADRERAHRDEKGARAFRPRRVGHLEGGGSADLAPPSRPPGAPPLAPGGRPPRPGTRPGTAGSSRARGAAGR